MKIKSALTSLFIVLALSLPAVAAEKKTAGPNGGRIIGTGEPRAEFFVTPERKVQITFLDPSGKAIAPADRVVTVIAGDRMSPTTLTFVQAGDKLISSAALPAGDAIPAVVQIKASASAATVTDKFNVDLARCGECKLAEYACTCAH